MENDQQRQYYQSTNGQSDEKETHQRPSELDFRESGSGEVVPGAPVVRSNTPRPLSFHMMRSASAYSQSEQPEEPWPIFPSKAPTAPPLPEELGGSESDRTAVEEVSLASETPLSNPDAQEFIWLFEYGLEMESSVLNSPERLDGLALLYGPAVLKGYSLMLTVPETPAAVERIVTIIPSLESGAEVWGVLYRVPRRLSEAVGGEPPLLDSVHSATPTAPLFHAKQVTVHESYRQRELLCTTYILREDARRQLHLVSLERQEGTAFVQRLAAIARRQKFPSHYLNFAPPDQQTLPVTLPPVPHVEQDTDPLPALKAAHEGGRESMQKGSAQRADVAPSYWLSAYALYLLILIICILSILLMQGLGFAAHLLTPSFTLPGLPWSVLLYGLLGGCLSCMIALGRTRSLVLPRHVILLWFARPFVGGTLALLVYLLFSSGFFVMDGFAREHHAFFPLLGALAGLCEGLLFGRR